jgi:hypothetical protein
VILNTHCDKCFQAFEIDLNSTEVPMLQDLVDENKTVSCPRGCGGRVPMSDDENALRGRHPIHLSGLSLYQALHGAGLPDEIPCDINVLAALLKANTVINVSVEEHNKKIYLHEIDMSDGSTIHLAAGLKGALVMKITKKVPDGV